MKNNLLWSILILSLLIVFVYSAEKIYFHKNIDIMQPAPKTETDTAEEITIGSSDLFQFVDADSVAAMTYIPPTALSFSDVGTIDWSSGTLKFSGKIDESAKIFFEYFWKTYFGNRGNFRRGYACG